MLTFNHLINLIKKNKARTNKNKQRAFNKIKNSLDTIYGHMFQNNRFKR